MKIIECVPNFSEGKNLPLIEQITSIIENDDSVHLLDVDSGQATNRTVVTFIGEPDKVVDIAFKLIKKASELIDMSKHKGEHPRMGGTDVCPLIPISNVSMKDCIKYSNILAKKVSSELQIPIFMYEKSAKEKFKENLSEIRKGEYEGMVQKITIPKWKPDYGKPVINMKSGVTAIGAREFLIAYNINLNTHEKKIATDIALDIRESGRAKRDKNGKILRDKNGLMLKVPGKLKFCKAVGWYIDEYNSAQVSINLTNYKKNSIHKTFEEVRKQARKRGLRVTGSEIVGLVPKQALLEAGYFYLKKQNQSLGIPEIDIIDIAVKSLGLNDVSKFTTKEKIIEYSITNKDTFANNTLENFINNISRSTPTPGGGSASALCASIGSGLTAMVSNLTINKKGYEKYRDSHLKSAEICQQYKDELINLIDEDSESYNLVIKAIRMPKKTKEQIEIRNQSIYKANVNAAKTPLKILKICNLLINETYKAILNGNPNSLSDAAAANDIIYSASKGASYNVLINIKDLNNKDKEYFKNNVNYYLKQIEDINLKSLTYINKEFQIK